MKMKMLVLTVCLVVLCVAVSSQASYFGGWNSTAWNDAGNWDTAVPTSGSGSVFIGSNYGYSNAGGVVTIGSGVAAVSDDCNIGWYVGTGALASVTVQGGSLTSSAINIGGNADSMLILDSGSVTDVAATRLGQYGGNGTLRINDGVYTAAAVWMYGGTTRIELLGGELNVDHFGFYNAEVTDMSFQIEGDGVFTWVGDLVDTLKAYKELGVIYTTGPGEISITEAGDVTTMQIIPEPATLTLLAAGLALVARKRRNR